MYTISQALSMKEAGDERWDLCSIALANALHGAPNNEKFSIARAIREIARQKLFSTPSAKASYSSGGIVGFATTNGTWDVIGRLSSDADENPSAVQWEMGEYSLKEASTSKDDNEITLFIVSAISSFIFAVQIRYWMDSDQNDFDMWKNDDHNVKGVYENADAETAGQDLWRQTDSILRKLPSLAGKPIHHIYRVTPINDMVNSWMDEGRI